MKRREFLAGLSTTATLPMMPTKALSGVLGASHAPELYAKAAKWAGIWEQSSVTMLKSQFGLDSRTAHGLFDQLVADRIVGAPDASGMARVAVSSIDKALIPERVRKVLKQEQRVETFDPAHKTSLEEASEIDMRSDADEKNAMDLNGEIHADAESDETQEF
jgi:hypothetical protein